MTVAAAGSSSKRGGWSWLWNRELDTYPDTGNRMLYLGITVLSTVVLYYQLYVGGSVSTLLLQKLHMSFSFFVYALAIGNLRWRVRLPLRRADRPVGTDQHRGGRPVYHRHLHPGRHPGFAQQVVLHRGQLGRGFRRGRLPGGNAGSDPGLLPQVGRATAMGFWTSGPVVGSLIVALVGAHTISAHASPSEWTHQYHIAGVAALVVAVIALLGLRELSPGLQGPAHGLDEGPGTGRGQGQGDRYRAVVA